MKKALSPVIATVGLIAIAFALFLIIFLWMRGFVGEKIMKFNTPIEKYCEDIEWDISIVGDNISINNLGNINIWKISIVKYLNGKKVKEFYFASGKEDEALPAGGYASFVIEGLSESKKIEIYPILLGKGEKKGNLIEYICENQKKEFNF